MSMYDESNNPIRSVAAYGELFSPSEVYHENSKICPSNTELFANIHTVNTTPKLRKIISRPFTTHPGMPSIPLPEATDFSSKSFESTLRERRSVREFNSKPISLAELSSILFSGDGIVSEFQDVDESVWSLRTAPSGGGLYPIDMYCISFDVETLEKGLYFYNAHKHTLERIKNEDYRNDLVDATHLSSVFETASCCIVLKCIMNRMNFKYGERAYRFALLEAGHIAQNLILGATSLGLASLPVGGFIDDRVNSILKIDGCEEFAIYLIAIGQDGPPQ